MKNKINKIVPMILFGGGMVIGGVIGTGTTEDIYKKSKLDAINNSPIKTEYTHINSDGIEDRVLSNKEGLYQEQFGYENKKGEIEYLTIGQIIKRNQSELEKTVERYKPQGKILK